jgi:methylmalonyl-CoA/ethylmalonyl-CoA epimerase
MKTINKTIDGLELAQIGWVVRDINAAVKFFAKAMGIADFPRPQAFRAQDLGLTYYGQLAPAEWLTSQAYNGGCFIELIQPVSGQSMFQDYLDRHPSGGVQHLAYRLPVAGFERVVADLQGQGYAVIAEVDHPIARMTFFDTYQAMGAATEIMGITPEGWAAIEQMEKSRT